MIKYRTTKTTVALDKKYGWLAKIIFGAYFLTVELVKSDRGIFPPGNVKAIGYDLLALFLYGGGLYLLYAGVRDLKAQKRPPS